MPKKEHLTDPPVYLPTIESALDFEFQGPILEPETQPAKKTYFPQKPQSDFNPNNPQSKNSK